MTPIDVILSAVRREVTRARPLYPPFHSQHEGAAVIKEECDELWDCIKASKGLHADGVTGLEAMQVAAMAIRFVADLCDDGEFEATLAGFERTR